MKPSSAALLASFVLALFAAPAAIAEDAKPSAPPASAPAPAAKTLVNKDAQGLAIAGYDPVAYFTDNKPVEGDKTITATYQGATYRFASAEHKSAFEKEPAKYAPAFGGYCGYGASIDKVVPVNPTVWQIVDGRLILQYSKDTYADFNKDLKASVAKADTNWPGLVQKNGK